MNAPTYQSEREPYCIHSRDYGGSVDHPASSCSTCKDGSELAAWRAYWAAKPYEFVAVTPRDGDLFLTGKFVERLNSGLEWEDDVNTQLVDGHLIHRRP